MIISPCIGPLTGNNLKNWQHEHWNKEVAIASQNHFSIAIVCISKTDTMVLTFKRTPDVPGLSLCHCIVLANWKTYFWWCFINCRLVVSDSLLQTVAPGIAGQGGKSSATQRTICLDRSKELKAKEQGAYMHTKRQDLTWCTRLSPILPLFSIL